MSSYNSYGNSSYKSKQRDYHKERPYHPHHGNHHNPHHTYGGSKRYGSGSNSGNGSGAGNGGNSGMGMTGPNSNSNHYHSNAPSYYRQHSGGHPHSESSRSHHYQSHHYHQPHHHHPGSHHQNSHHYPHHQSQHPPHQRAHTPNQAPYRQQSHSPHSQVTSTPSDESLGPKWSSSNMEQVASYLEKLYLEAERIVGDQSRPRSHGSISAHASLDRPHRRQRPQYLPVESPTSDGPVSPKSFSAEPSPFFSKGQQGRSKWPRGEVPGPPHLNENGSTSRGGSSSSSHEQGASSSDEQQYATPDPPASPTALELVGHKPGVQ